MYVQTTEMEDKYVRFQRVNIQQGRKRPLEDDREKRERRRERERKAEGDI